MKQRERAFTLIELMVVIIIIGILLGILFTGWNYINEQQASKKAKLEVVGLKNAVDEYLADYGEYPNCPKGICTPGETLFMSLAGFHNENGSLELPPYTSKIPTHLFHYDLSAYDEMEIPDISHGGGTSLQLWLAKTLGKDPAFIDPWGNEYVYEFPLEDGGPGYRLFSKGPDGKTGEEFTADDVR